MGFQCSIVRLTGYPPKGCGLLSFYGKHSWTRGIEAIVVGGDCVIALNEASVDGRKNFVSRSPGWIFLPAVR